MKKKIVSLALAVCLLAIAAVGTLAYFTDKTQVKENTFTVGNVKIDLTEPNWEGTGKEDAPEVYAGEALAKDPTVENVGANPCFVRVKVTGLDQFDVGAITLRYIDEQGVYHEGYNANDWTYNEADGYYYYNKVLATKATAGDQYNQGLTEKTTPVFSQVVMPTGLEGNEKTTSIDVVAEAVQAQGAKASYSAVKAMTVAEIAAWFGTCGMNK